MIIKLEKVINCTSEDPAYPAKNLLKGRTDSPWRCEKPGELLASITLKLAEPSRITGLDIGNYRCCIVIVTASTSSEPDNWIPIVNHQFMSHDEAANGKFKDQVQLFTKKELNADNLGLKFDRVKVTCMQSANLREVFGLAFFILRTEASCDLGPDIFGRFKLKETPAPSPLSLFKDDRLKMLPSASDLKPPNYKEALARKIKEEGAASFAKRQENPGPAPKRPNLEKLAPKVEAAEEKKENLAKNGSPVARTPFGDPIEPKKDKKPSTDGKNSNLEKLAPKAEAAEEKKEILAKNGSPMARTPFGDPIEPKKDKRPSTDGNNSSRLDCKCAAAAQTDKDEICTVCKKLKREKFSPPPKKAKIAPKPTKAFGKLFEDVKFALSGYVNPRRDEIRRKALKMGGKYVADPNTTNNKCSHLICAFKNTPKSQQLKGHAKIVSHDFIEQCFDEKKRLPWRRFAFSGKEKAAPESEEEIEASESTQPPSVFDQETDSDSGDY